MSACVADVGFKLLNMSCLLCSLLSSLSRSQTCQVRGCPPPLLHNAGRWPSGRAQQPDAPAAGRQKRGYPGDAAPRCWKEQCSTRLQSMQQDYSCPGLAKRAGGCTIAQAPRPAQGNRAHSRTTLSAARTAKTADLRHGMPAAWTT